MKRRTFTAIGGSLGEELARSLGITLARARELTEAGAVYVDGKRCREAGRSVVKGAQLIAVLEEAGREAGVPVPERQLTVLYEDARLIAVDKPPGVLAQPGPSGGENLVELVTRRLGREAGL